MARSMNKPGIVVHIGTEYTDRDLKRAQADLRRLETGAKGTTGTMSKFGTTMQNAVGRNLYSVQTALAGAVAGMGAFAVSMAVDGVKSAMAEEQQLAKLRNALDNVDQGFAMGSVTQFIDRLMYATNVVDDELRPAFQTLVGVTRDAAKAQDLLTLAVDISADSGKSLATVSTALAKAAGGQATALNRILPGLSNGTRGTQNFEETLAKLQSRFSGAAAAAADTFAGRLKNLQIVFDESKEAFGTGFLEGIESSLGGLGTLGDAFVGLQPQVENLGRELGHITGQVIILTAELSKIRESLGPVADFINPIQGLANMFTVLNLGIEAGKDSLDLIPQASDRATSGLHALAGSDFTNLQMNLHRVSIAADDVAKTRTMSIVVETRFAAGAAGVSDYVTRALDDYFAALEAGADATNAAGAQAAAEIDPFKEWQKALAQSGRSLAMRAKLIAKGIPAAMADGILSDPNWPKIADRLMKSGREAIAGYVEQWKRAPEGVEAIGSEVERIVDAAQRRLDTLNDERERFAEIRRGFFEESMEFGKLTTLQGEAPVTAAAITENLRQRLAIVRQFATALEKLQAAGLGRSALGDVIALGPFEGLQYANAILAGGATTIRQIQTISGEFVRPSERIANIGAEVTTGKTAQMLDQSTNFTVQAGGINITVNGEITAQTRREIETAVTDAFGRVGRESRARGRTGVR